MNRSIASVLFVVGMWGCGNEGESESVSLPTVRRLSLAALESHGPELRRKVLAVSPYGHVAFTGGLMEGEELVRVVDSTGAVIGEFGAEGGGPGELRGADYMFFQDSTLFVFDVFQGRVNRYATIGEYIGAMSLEQLYMPIGHVTDSIDLGDYSQATGSRTFRYALDGTAGYRELISSSDTLFAQILERTPRVKVAQHRMTLGSSLLGTVLGNGDTYTLLEFGPSGVAEFGRYLEPYARVVESKTDTIPYMGVYSFGVDYNGLFWVAGKGPNGGFLDAWESRRLVGRQSVPCVPNDWFGMSVAGSFMALLCLADEDADTDVTLQLYKIEN